MGDVDQVHVPDRAGDVSGDELPAAAGGAAGGRAQPAGGLLYIGSYA